MLRLFFYIKGVKKIGAVARAVVFKSQNEQKGTGKVCKKSA
jgi:hypothetical protein